MRLPARIGAPAPSWSEWLHALWERVAGVWNYAFHVQDSPITVGKLLLALVLLGAGTFVARAASRMLARRLLARFGLDAGATATFQTLAFYTLVVVLFLYALQLVGIPLTAFTVLGGALAIGVGFGSQAVVNNFISGLILMAERPIKVGDVIEVGGLYGTVEHIGARSTRVRKGDNTHIIVPNSEFLEKSVVNWTLSDDVLRAEVTVGVAYGSPPERVRELLHEAMRRTEGVLSEPEPEVMFDDFGDDALVFRALFWIRVMRPLDRCRIGSRLRYRIDEVFRAHGITIAFPQRDVHVDSPKPIAVRIVGDREPD
jgi:small-conductance mechanosensitive channel